MIPGLINWQPEIKQGDVTAITGQSGVPIAVGVAALDFARLSRTTGEKGKAVYLVHCYLDELWALGSKSHPQTATSPELVDATQQLSLPSPVDIDEAHADAPCPTISAEPSILPASQNAHDVAEPSTTGNSFSLRV